MLMAEGADVNATDLVREEGGRRGKGDGREGGHEHRSLREGARDGWKKGAGMYASARTSGWMCVLMCKVCLSVFELC